MPNVIPVHRDHRETATCVGCVKVLLSSHLYKAPLQPPLPATDCGKILIKHLGLRLLGLVLGRQESKAVIICHCVVIYSPRHTCPETRAWLRRRRPGS